MSKTLQFLAALSFLAGPMALWAERRYRALPALKENACHPSMPSLSIIIPARNEAKNLQRLLPSLQCLAYNGPYEIIVVDDQSTDNTSAVARQFTPSVLAGHPLPEKWLGKPHACHQGALAAKGDWFLFTDADTFHQPHGPARAVANALEKNLDGLSLFIHQETSGLADTLALLVAFAGIFAALPQETSILNGQYILLRRDVYLESGGFSAVATEPLEDLALGHHLKSLHFKVPVMRGEDAASVRMYQNFNNLWQGLVRLGSGSLGWLGLHSLVSVLFITAVMMPLLIFINILTGRLRPWWLLVGWLSSIVGFLSWGRRFGAAAWAFLAPIGAFIVQIAATWGLVSRFFGRGFQWKGRTV